MSQAPGRLHHARRWLWTGAVVVAALLFVRAFLADVRRVESGSMEPTLRTGEWVLVLLDDAPPRAGELVVARESESARPVVKRVVGLPGETVRVSAGDLYIDGAPRRASEDDELWIEVADSAKEPFAAAWSVPSGWTDAAGALRGDAGSGPLRLDSVDDGWSRPERVRGPHEVADLRVACELAAGGDAIFELQLRQRGEALRARLERRGGELLAALATAAAEPSEPEWTTRARATGKAAAPGASQRIEFSVRDGRADLHVDGTELASIAPLGWRLHRADQAQEGRSYPPRALLRFVAGAGEVRRLRVERDLHWQPAGTHAVQRDLPLGPDQCFLLGDASFQSRDGRHWGPTPLAELVGRPVAVVWPPSAWRRPR
ncbi:MAG: Signal peptidase [Planctomycetota bacterium]|jgi:signal peptidase I